jgi:hypothetical protein
MYYLLSNNIKLCVGDKIPINRLKSLTASLPTAMLPENKRNGGSNNSWKDEIWVSVLV